MKFRLEQMHFTVFKFVLIIIIIDACLVLDVTKQLVNAVLQGFGSGGMSRTATGLRGSKCGKALN